MHWESVLIRSLYLDASVSLQRDVCREVTLCLSELNPEVQTQLTEQQAAAAAAAAEAARSSRVWTPLDNYNEKFIHLVKRREEAPLLNDYEKSNKVFVARVSGLFIMLGRAHMTETSPLCYKIIS